MKNNKYPNLFAEMIRHGELTEDLAKFLGMKYGALHRRFIGRTKFSVNEAIKICEHYGKSFEELFMKNV